MAYEPLHHKYRPATFADLVGQEAIANTLSSALRQQRIAPAYLFSGPRGTGKTSSARILAKSLNCEASDRPTPSPCGQCEVCRSITKGTAVDVIEIDAASNTGVDNIRELIERAQFAPVRCRYKVYAIDECHMLSTAAFNSLLKTLEEPPDRVVFVLATTDPQRVLPTIISRCQRFDYRRIRLEAMVAHLAHISELEQIDIAPDALTLVAQIAQGGMRDAESLLDQLSLLGERVQPQHVWNLVGAVPERDLLALVQAITSDRPETVLDCCRSMLDRGREPLTVLQSLASFYRDFLVAKTASDRQSLTSVTNATWPELCEFAQSWSVEQILLGGQHLRHCEGQIKNTTQPRLWLEVSLLGLLPSAIAPRSSATPQALPAFTPPPAAAPTPPPSPSPAPAPAPSPEVPTTAVEMPDWDAIDPDMSPDVPATRTEPIAPIYPPAPTRIPARAAVPPPPLPTPPPTPAASDVQIFDLPQVWQQVLGCVSKRASLEFFNQKCHLSAFDGQAAQVAVSSRGLKNIANSKQKDIEAAFRQVFGAPIAVVIHIAADATAPAAAIDPRQPPSPDPSTASAPPAFPPAAIALPAPPPTPPSQPPAPLPASPAPLPASPATFVPSPLPPPQPVAPLPTAATPSPPVPPESIAPAPSTPLQPATPPATASPRSAPPPTKGATLVSASGRQWDDTEIANAAQSFATFFKGEVVTLDDDVLE